MIIKRISSKKYDQIKYQRRISMVPSVREQGYLCNDNRSYYREIYLKSNEWKILRDCCLKKYPKCNLCGKDAIDCHHVNYKNLFNVKQTDIRSLCRECHTYLHELLKNGKLTFEEKDGSYEKWMKTIKSVIYWKLLRKGLKWDEARETSDRIMSKFVHDRKIARPKMIYILNDSGDINTDFM